MHGGVDGALQALPLLEADGQARVEPLVVAVALLRICQSFLGLKGHCNKI